LDATGSCKRTITPNKAEQQIHNIAEKENNQNAAMGQSKFRPQPELNAVVGP